MTTIKDVASYADVSIATVSNYINNTKPVSKKASKSIQEAIEKLKYSQNFSAKSLKSNTYTDIGIILPTFNDSYYVQLFQGIELAFQNTNYFLNLAFSYDIPDIEQNIVRNFMKKNVCGLILVSCQPNNWRFYYDNFTSHNKPIVLIDRYIKSLDANFISFDNYSTTQYITKQLIDIGYRNPYLFTGPAQFECEMQCIKGFEHAMTMAHLPLTKNAIQQTNLNREDAFRQTVHLLKSEIPDVIVTTSESSAVGIMEGLRILGYSSFDIPVVTLGEEHWNKQTHSFAALSSVRPAMNMGETAAELLFRKIKSPQIQENEKIILHDKILDEDFKFTEAFRGKESHTQPVNKEINVLMLDTPQVHALTSLLKNFENTYGIKANITILPHHLVFDEITSSHLSNNSVTTYDVYMFDIPWLYSLASLGILANISDTIEEIKPELFLPDCLKYFSSFNGKYYGVPFMYAPQIFYYRKDLFDDPILKSQYETYYSSALRPPLTWKEFNVIAEFFTTKTDVIPYGMSIPAAYNECLSPEIYMRLSAYGSKIYDHKSNVVFDTPQTLKAYVNLAKAFKYVKPNYKVATDTSVVNDFLNGETAMLVTYPSFLMDVVDLRTSSMIGSIGYNHIPGNSPILGGWSLGVSAKSSKTEDAFRFIKWACSDEISNYFALLGGQSLITSAYTNDELVKLYPWLPLYHSAYQNIKPVIPPCLNNNVIIPQSKLDTIICDEVRKMITEESDVETTIAVTQRKLDELFQSYR